MKSKAAIRLIVLVAIASELAAPQARSSTDHKVTHRVFIGGELAECTGSGTTHAFVVVNPATTIQIMDTEGGETMFMFEYTVTAHNRSGVVAALGEFKVRLRLRDASEQVVDGDSFTFPEGRQEWKGVVSFVLPTYKPGLLNDKLISPFIRIVQTTCGEI